ncbi:GntR family transcriptional regulator [Listeria grandensis]|uniref:GntR family transcriptional regulator n=1 Tax=Listeria grandensis TaxID=1494963 RepID=A0A7X0Y4X8_9LIST|nr:GntR family transcriptional regulator [Listeria grandensis]MBC1475102.1 GntR family transcriptional regulator [Listeria grandensis]MBC1936989.1 GntR family transcriptional regulator [Listeria grandensis]MBC6315674.1 GntR family transcriptional regulator [Listeria grandensis]
MYTINSQSHVPIYEQIVAIIKDYCIRGVLEPGEKLMSVREMSAHILVNPNTVSKAYKELERIGIIETKLGKGAYVAYSRDNGPNQEALALFRKNLEQLILEANYLQIEEQELKGLVNAYYTSLEG